MKHSPLRLLLPVFLAFGSDQRTLWAQAIRINHPSVVKPLLSTGTITISATPSQVAFQLVGAGASNGSSGISISTSATGLTLLSSASLYAYFSSSNALTDSNGDNIPASDVFGLCSTGTPTTYTAFTQMSPFNGSSSSLLIWHTANLVSLTSGRTDVLQLKIDLTSIPQLPAARYSGSLILQVQAL